MNKQAKILFLGLFFTGLLVSAQDDSEAHFSIEWLSNFSAEKDIESSGGVFSQFIDLVTGETEEKLAKPFNLVKYDDDSFFILDQGKLSPLIVNKDGITIVESDDYKVFPSLVGVCKFTENKILFTDSKLSEVFIYDVEEEEVEKFALSQSLEKPTGIAYDKTNKKIFISETSKHRVAVFNAEGKLLKFIGERGTAPGHFNFPTFLTVDKSGNLYVVDAMNFRVEIFDADGKFINSFGEAGDATGYFNRPKGITLDSFGHIYLVDALFHTVQIFDVEGKFLYNFGGLGQVNSRFWMPVGIYIDEENNIFIADSYNGRIQIFRLVDGKK